MVSLGNPLFAFDVEDFSDILLVVDVADPCVTEDESEEKEAPDDKMRSSDRPAITRLAKRQKRAPNVVTSLDIDDEVDEGMGAAVKKEFWLSRQRLASASGFFRTMLSKTSGWQESKNTSMRTVLLHEEERTPFVDLLQSFYGAPLNVGTPNALRFFFVLADRYCVEGVGAVVVKALEQQQDKLCPEMVNILFTLPGNMSKEDDMRPLLKFRDAAVVDRYRNLNDADVRTSVYTLCRDALLVLLTSDALEVTSENVVLRVVVDWLSHNPRSTHADRRRLFACVRFCHITQYYLSDVVMRMSNLLELPLQSIADAVRMTNVSRKEKDWRDFVASAKYPSLRKITPHQICIEAIVPIAEPAITVQASEATCLDGHRWYPEIVFNQLTGTVGFFMHIAWPGGNASTRGCMRIESLTIELRTRDGDWKTLWTRQPWVWNTPRSNFGKSNAIDAEYLGDPDFVGRLQDNTLQFRCTLVA
jgi:hypothetical protein